MSLIPLGFWSGSEVVYPIQTGLTNCWSLILRVPGYTGACIRVRRSSDSTEQDINFVNGIVDTATIATFVGAGTGYVMVWYDQKDAYDLSPYYPSSGTQFYPIIRLSGTTQTDSRGTPSIRFGNTEYTALFTSAGGTRLINANSGTIYYSYQATTPVSPTTVMNLGGNNNGNSVQNQVLSGGTGGSSVFWDWNSPQTYRYLSGTTITTLTGPSPDFFVTSGTTYSNFVINSKILICEPGVGWNTLGTGHSIGGRGNGNTNSYFQGFINEYLIYGSTVHNTATQQENLNKLAIINKTN